LHTTYFEMREGRKLSSGQDTALSDAAAGVREICGLLGQSLALGECFTIELGDADRVLLVFEPELDHLLAGIGDRASLAALLGASAPDSVASRFEGDGSELAPGVQALWALQAQPGMLGGLIGGPSGLLLASSLRGGSAQRALSDATEQLARLFRFWPELQLQPSSCNMRFAAHHVAAAVGESGWVALLGLASSPAHELHVAAQGIARHLPAAAASSRDPDVELDGELTAVFTRLQQP
jgi:hypothetical protein